MKTVYKICKKCGQGLPKNILSCPNCGCYDFVMPDDISTTNDVPLQIHVPINEEIYQPISDNVATNIQPVLTEPVVNSVLPNPQKPAYRMQYAGFFRRFFAYVFDVLFIFVAMGLIYQILLIDLNLNDETISLITLIFYLIVMALTTSRGRQASIGKIMMGLWVFDTNGKRIGFWHAFFREFIKLILLPCTFIMIFASRKQGLHDLIVNTVVLFDVD